MSTEDLILVEQTENILKLTFNRPKALNALNGATLDALASALDQVSDEVRVIILTGAGEKAFVAGADIAEMAALSPTEAASFSA